MKYVFLPILISVFSLAFSQKVIIIDDDIKSEISVPQYVYTLEDPNGSLSVEQIILSKDDDFKFNTEGKILNFGFTNSVYWIKFSILNNTNINKNLVFSIKYPLLNSIDFIEIKNLKVSKHINTGIDRPFNSREINNRNFLFDLKINSNSKYDYYVRIDSKGGPIHLPMSISPYKSYIDQDNRELLIYGGFLGVFFFVIIFNLFFYILTRDKLYAYNSGYVIILTLFLLTLSGISYQYLWPSFPWLQIHAPVFSAGVSNILLILFSKEFFNYFKYFHRTNKLTKLFLFFIGFLSILSLFDGNIFVISELLVNVSTLLTILFLTIVSIKGVQKYNSLHYYFIFSFLSLLIGASVYVLNNLGLLKEIESDFFFLSVGSLIEVILLLFAIIHKYRLMEKRTNIELEQIVNNRTYKLEKQNGQLQAQTMEILIQRDKILSQHRKSLKQNELIIEKSKEINASIAYAKLIQNAVLPQKRKLDSVLNNYFILNKPKDILSGDFYWVHKKNKRRYIAVADCTGHGVPGAMLSMLGISALNDIVLKDEYLNPADILNKLSKMIEGSLNQGGQFGPTKDGMDISLCMIDDVSNTLLYAGANNPLYIYRKAQTPNLNNFFINQDFNHNHLLIVKPEKLSIGHNYSTKLGFSNKKVDLQDKDMIYMFSDGFADQFGGIEGKKYKKKRFKELLSINANMEDNALQYKHMDSNFNNWIENREQVDDVLVIGFRALEVS